MCSYYNRTGYSEAALPVLTSDTIYEEAFGLLLKTDWSHSQKR